MKIIIISISMIFWSPSFAGDTSLYTQVNNKKTCKFSGNDEACEYSCEGPIKEVKTLLYSCSDYEHLFIEIDGKTYSTWSSMLGVGGFSGIGNKQGTVEWILEDAKKASREILKGLIVRFEGSDDKGKTKSELAVFDLKKDSICWKGNFKTNEKARKAVKDGKCLEPLDLKK